MSPVRLDDTTKIVSLISAIISPAEGKYKGRPASIEAAKVARVAHRWHGGRSPSPKDSVSLGAAFIGCSIKSPPAQHTEATRVVQRGSRNRP
jgi:hypothetical protein